jgi:protein ImuB
LSAALERADRGAVALQTRLTLVTREVHERVLRLPDPMRDPRVFRTLVMLDLEAHPPSAGIDVVELEVDVTPGRIVQGSLLARTLPAPEDLATLMARLSALMGESRVGAPADVDTFDARAVGMTRFAPASVAPDPAKAVQPAFVPVLRRFRQPVVARVVLEHGRPVRVMPAARDLPGGRITMSAGPWRTSGWWWATERGWDRDEWDVELASRGVVYRMTRSRPSGEWEIEGAYD